MTVKMFKTYCVLQIVTIILSTITVIYNNVSFALTGELTKIGFYLGNATAWVGVFAGVCLVFVLLSTFRCKKFTTSDIVEDLKVCDEKV